MLVSSWLRAVLVFAAALALVTATGVLAGSSKAIASATSATFEPTPDDDGAAAVAIMPRPVIVAALISVLALVGLTAATPSGVVRQPGKARGPPPR